MSDRQRTRPEPKRCQTCGHQYTEHFRWDGATSKCRVRKDGKLAMGGSQSDCKCQLYVTATTVREQAAAVPIESI